MRVLLVVHGFPPRAGRGTEIYVRDLARALHEGFADDVLVLAREEDPHRRELAVRRERRDGITVAFVNNTFRDCRSFEESYRHPALRRVAAEIVDDFDPEVAHVHHLTCLSTEIVTDLAERGVPVVLTLNDYWLMCHRGQLLDRDYRQCAGPAATGCGRCVDVAGGAAGLAYRAAALARGVSARVPASVSRVLDTVGRAALTGTVPQAAVAEATRRRAAHMRSLLPLVTRVLAPSQTIADRFTAFGVAPEQMVRQEQGIDIRPFRTHPRVAGDRLRLGFVGSLLISKGPHVALEAFAGLPAGAASLTVLGAHADYHGDAHYRARLAPLLVQPGVVHAGAVARAEVARALSAMDALIVPSVWIENAPFVIREAFAAGVPVIASRLGGMAEMVRDGVDGLLFSAGDVGDLRRTLHRLLEEPGLLDTLRAGIPRVRTIEEDAAWTREIYGGLRASSPPRVTGRARVAAVVLNYRTPDDTALAVRSLLASRRAPDDVIVVDNGSGHGSVASLRALPPAVTVMETASNLGYSAGCNVGIREALARKADLVWLVNSDVVAPPDALERLEDALAFEPRAGIAGPVVLSRAHPETVASLGVTFSSVTGRMRSLGFGARYGTVAPPACAVVDAVNGCAMLVRREVFERVGLLTEDYFFSFEDLDLCLRARAAGFLTILAGGAVVYHEGGRSIGARSARRVYYATRNHLLLARRAAPAPGPARGLLRAGVIVGLNLAHALLTAGVPRAAGVAAVARGAWDHARGRYGAGPGPAALS